MLTQAPGSASGRSAAPSRALTTPRRSRRPGVKSTSQTFVFHESRPPRHRRDAHRSTACGCACKDVCDPSEENLSDFEVWRREEGFWYGEYTFLGAEGDPYVSSSWNYPYDHYNGFIHIELDGNSLKQRNVFIYPPQTAEKCEADDSTEGDGVCGVNGNEKVFGSLDFCDCDPDSDCSPLAGDEFCACAEAQACCSVSYQCINQICRGASSPPVAKSRPPRHRRDASTPGSLVGFVHRPLLPRSSAPAASAARVWPPKTAVLNPGRSSPSAPDIRPRLPKSDRTAGAASGSSTPREVDRVTSASPNQ